MFFMLRSTHLAVMANQDKALAVAKAELANMGETIRGLDAAARLFKTMAGERQARLDQIAKLETPRCASVGKRMAGIARGAQS